MSKKLIILALSLIIYTAIRLLLHFYVVIEADLRAFLIRLGIEIIGVIILSIVIDFIWSLVRYWKWAKINKSCSDKILLRIQQNILTTLNQFEYLDFWKSEVEDLSKMKNLLLKFLNEEFDRFIIDKINNLNEKKY